MLNEHIDIIRTFLPPYLNEQSQNKLIKDIEKDFPESKDPFKVYLKLEDENNIYQGDSMIDIPFPVFNKSLGQFEISYQSGISLSNTCDVLPEHHEKRIDKINIQFARIFSLQDYIERLRKKDIKDDRIETFKLNLRKNHISNLFHLPEKRNENSVILPESFVKFDDSVTLSPTLFQENKYNLRYSEEDGDKIFSFSNYGFYLFLLKLSVHYSRIREGVFRDN